MDKILNRICSIDNHPIAKLDIKFRMQYVEGLVACMYSISKGSDIAKTITFAWVHSIHATAVDLLWKDDVEAVKKAISLKRKGMRFFYMRAPFFFDVFYLTQASDLGKSDFNKVSEYLRQNVCGYFSKKSLNKIFLAYKQNSSSIDGVSSAQIKHRNTNNKILSGTEKRILVVANVSAGKSTLINALVGYRFNRTKTTACTDKLVYIHNKCSKDGITCKIKNGVYTYSENINEGNSADNCSHRQITEDIIKKGDYEVVLYVSNCQYFGTNDEHKLLKFLKANVTKPILFVLNQLDVFNPEEDSIHKMLNDYKSDLIQFGFKNPTVIPISAYTSFLVRLESSCLTKTEVTKKNNMLELFKDEYYNLPQYIGQGNSSEILDMAGIKVLEDRLITI